MTFTKQQYLDSEARAVELISKYGHIISKTNCGLDIPRGWYDLVERVFQILDASGFPDIRVQQIKEKFGGLRIYYEGGDQALYEKTAKITDQAFQTCDICGAEGSPDNAKDTWRRTRCMEHVNTEWPKLTEKEYRAIDRARNKIKSKFSPEQE